MKWQGKAVSRGYRERYLSCVSRNKTNLNCSVDQKPMNWRQGSSWCYTLRITLPHFQFNFVTIHSTKSNNNNNYYFYYYYYYFSLYAGYSQLYTWNKPCLYGIHCCSYSVVTVHGAYNAVCNVKSFVRLHQYFPQYMCSAQYGCFL